MMKVLSILCLVSLAACFQASATEPFNTLFMTKQERQALDKIKKDYDAGIYIERKEIEADTKVVTEYQFNGYIRTPNSKDTLFVNGEVQNQPLRMDQSGRSKVRVLEQTKKMKPGQVFQQDNNTIEETFDGQVNVQ